MALLPLLLAGAGIGSQILGGALGSKKKEYNPEDMLVYKQLPDYPEATGARQSWWNKLQDWGNQPGYGAIAPDWADIWDLAKKKVDQYYYGGVNDTGLAGKLKASAARRNVSQSPALENMLLSMGMEQGSQMSDLAKNEAINKATFSEQGRQNWLSSIQNLSQLKPSYMTASGPMNLAYPESESSNFWDLIGGLGGTLTGNVMQGQSDKNKIDLLTQMLNQQNNQNRIGQYTPSGLNSWYGQASPNTGRDPGYRVPSYMYQ